MFHLCLQDAWSMARGASLIVLMNKAKDIKMMFTNNKQRNDLMFE